MVIINKILSLCDVKSALIVTAVNLICLSVLWYFMSFYDTGFYVKHLLLAIFTILLWGFFVGVIGKVTTLKSNWVCWIIPYAYLIAEFINKMNCNKIYLGCQIYHFFIFGTTILLADFIFRRFLFRGKTIGANVALVLLCFAEYLILIFPILLILNRLLTGTRIDTSAVIAICQSSPQEAWYYFILENRGWWILGAFLLSLTIFFLHCFRVLREKNPAPVLSCKIISVVSLISLGGFIAAVNAFSSNELYQSQIWGLVVTPFRYADAISDYKALRETHLSNVFARLKNEDRMAGNDGVFLLVIGESLNRHHMSCYGYDIPTTPIQDSLSNGENFFLFRKAYSNHVQTVQVLTLALTNKNQYNFSNLSLEDAISLFDLSKHYGYHTRWLANQGLSSLDFTPTAALAASADSVYYAQTETNLQKRQIFDIELLKAISDTGKREVIVMHLQGQHFPYSACVPDDFESNPKWSSYDRSVYYNDYVMGQIIKLAQERKFAAVIYCSDHSEGVSMERGHDPRPERFLPEMCDIPLWVYLSPEYAASHPELPRLLQNGQSKYFTNDLLFDLMFAVMGIENSFTPSEFNILSENYSIHAENSLTLWGGRRISSFNEVAKKP